MCAPAPHSVEYISDLPVQINERADVIDDKVGACEFGVQGHLGGFTSGEFRIVPPAGVDALLSLVEGGIDEDHGVAFTVYPSLEEQGRVDDNGWWEWGRHGGRGDAGATLHVDNRMDKRFKITALRRIGEDDRGNRGAADLSGRIED